MALETQSKVSRISAFAWWIMGRSQSGCWTTEPQSRAWDAKSNDHLTTDTEV
jgi:hypothetical protein